MTTTNTNRPLATRVKTFASEHSRLLFAILAGALVVFIISYLVLFRPQPLQYSYDANDCTGRLTLLPELSKATQNDFKLEARDRVTLAGVDLVARQMCVVAVNAPQEKSQSVASISPFGLPIFKTTYKIETPAYPAVSSELEQPVPLSKPLKITLTKPDSVFTYALVAKDKQTVCTPKQATLRCNVAELALGQGETHEIVLQRSFKRQKIDTPLSDTITTLAPVEIKDSSIKNDAVVHEKPQEITLMTNKRLESATAVLEKQGDTVQEVKSTVSVDGDGIKIITADELERDAQFKLTVTASAKDGSSLAQPYVTTFKTSGGPKVTSVSIGSSGYVPGVPIIIRFDQPLHPDTQPSKFVGLEGITGSMSVQGSEIVITPQTVGRCASFSLSVKKGVTSKYDVVSTTDWNMASRAQCYTIGSIGTSVNGRPITAYYFGSGNRSILYTGAIHGNELSSKYIMDSWINELDARAGEIPADVTLVVVPVANPDGTAVGQRANVRGVNLNRNFPTHNWESDIVTGGSSERQKGEGGSSAGSEPETQALMRITQQLNPSLVVTYHSRGSLVNSNDAGNSIAKAQQYANLAGYSFISNAATTSTFGFTMTGTFEDWLLERGTAAFLIELNTNSGNHFTQNRTALWSTMR